MSLVDLLRRGGWTKPSLREERRVRRYSTTGDILSYKRCRRQYGFFGVRKFSSATATQRYFGTLVHDVLDQVHRDYRIRPVLPDVARIQELVAQAHDRLVRSGVRPYNARLQDELAVRLIHRFVVLIGPHFYQHVRQTEYRLERALRTPSELDYILDGVVDVLAGAVSHALGLPGPTRSDDVEIWDYKSGDVPEAGSALLQDYEYQLSVYCELYRQQTGRLPARAVLVFLGQLGDDARWAASRGRDPKVFPGLFHVVRPEGPKIQAAIADFHRTVEAIERELARPYGAQWQAPAHDVDRQTCEACEIRYNCGRFAPGRRQMAEAL